MFFRNRGQTKQWNTTTTLVLYTFNWSFQVHLNTNKDWTSHQVCTLIRGKEQEVLVNN